MKYIIPIFLVILFTQCNCNHEENLTIATYNIRYENSGDSVRGNSWNQRCPVICDIIRFNDFDVFGAQEVLNDQLKDMLKKLPEYNYVGVARDDGKTKGEYAPVFYKKNKFTLMNSGHFWLSEITDKPNKGWDAALPRICTWTQLKENSSNLQFWFFNLHMDHIGVEARKNSAKLVVQKIKEMCGTDPVILTGDFNVDQNSPNYAVLVNSGILNDSYKVAKIRYATNGTFNDFNPNMKTESRIDHIFVTSSFTVERYGVLTDTYRSEIPESKEVISGNFPKEVTLKEYTARTPSDHFPVKVVLKYSK